MAHNIFISYRRDDSGPTAGRLYDRLAEKFGEANIFIDVDNMPAGVDFVKHLNKQVNVATFSSAPWARTGLALRMRMVIYGSTNQTIT